MSHNVGKPAVGITATTNSAMGCSPRWPEVNATIADELPEGALQIQGFGGESAGRFDGAGVAHTLDAPGMSDVFYGAFR